MHPKLVTANLFSGSRLSLATFAISVQTALGLEELLRISRPRSGDVRAFRSVHSAVSPMARSGVHCQAMTAALIERCCFHFLDSEAVNTARQGDRRHPSYLSWPALMLPLSRPARCHAQRQMATSS